MVLLSPIELHVHVCKVKQMSHALAKEGFVHICDAQCQTSHHILVIMNCKHGAAVSNHCEVIILSMKSPAKLEDQVKR